MKTNNKTTIDFKVKSLFTFKKTSSAAYLNISNGGEDTTTIISTSSTTVNSNVFQKI